VVMTETISFNVAVRTIGLNLVKWRTSNVSYTNEYHL
jgi:hypothetical protein